MAVRPWSLLSSTLLLAALSAACAGTGEPEPEPMTEPEAEPESEPDAPPRACGVDLPTTVSVAQRGSLAISAPLTVEGGVRLEDVTVTVTAPDGWRARYADGAVQGRAGDATGDVIVDVSCPDADGALATVQVEVTPWVVSQLPVWVPGDTGPLGREYFNMWVDPVDADTMWLFGGFHYVPQQFTVGWDMWRYDLEGESWTEVEALTPAPQLAGAGLAVFPAGHDRAGEALRYGGLTGDFGLPFSLTALRLSEAGATWSEAPVTGAPGAGAYQPATFYDPARDVVWTIGGQGAGGTHADVARYDVQAATWSSVDVAFGSLPSGRTGFFWVFDEARDRFLMAFGEQGGAAQGCHCAHDTWMLDLSVTPPRWTPLATGAAQQIGRRNGAFALDPVERRLFVFGGTADGASTFPGLWMLDLDEVDAYDFSAAMPADILWHEVDIDAAIPLRSSGAMVYDAARHRMVLGFGNGQAGVHRDLWAIDL